LKASVRAVRKDFERVALTAVVLAVELVVRWAVL
jgi:hypothetical protein